MTKASIFWRSGIPLALVLGCGGGSSTSSIGAGGIESRGGDSSTGGSTPSVGGTTSSTMTSAGGSSSGGVSQTAGGATASGGATGVGGTTTTSSVEATGGVKPTGGSSTQTNNSGGTVAVGGASPTGGMKAVGGASPTGGMKASGGVSSTGGASSASGGTSAGGTNNGVAGGPASTKSSGCGIASPLKTGNFTESIGGTARKWMLDVPANYDGTKPYRLIFVWHPLGGSGSQIVTGGFNGLKSLANNAAVFATADGLSGKSASGTSGTGWWNENGGDMKLVQAMLDKINAGLCIDQQRIFSTGFSFGGMMSYTLPFEFDVFRAVAPCSGKTGIIPYNAKYNRPIPIMAFHGDKDTVAQTALGREFFDMYRVTRNHCGDQTNAVDPSPCVQYQDCDEPTTWCLFSGAHEVWSAESQAIWRFFSQF